MNKMVSIIMPCYNSSRFLPEAIQSVLQQSYGNWELLIMDDCSTDGSLKVAIEYSNTDSRIKVHPSFYNKGVSYQLNKAISCSKGEYIARIDSDDIIDPEKLSKQLTFLEQEKDCVLCSTYYIKFASNNTSQRQFIKTPIDFKAIKVGLLKDLPICGASFMCRKEVFDKFKFNEELQIGEDYDWISRIAVSNKIYTIPEYLYRYRKHGNSLTDSSQHWAKADIDLIRIQYLNSLGIDFENELKKFFLCLMSTRTSYKVSFLMIKKVRCLVQLLVQSKELEATLVRKLINNLFKSYILSTKNYSKLVFIMIFYRFPELFYNTSLKDKCRIIMRSVYA